MNSISFAQKSVYPSRRVQWGILTVLLIVLYRSILVKWGMDLWEDPNYSHGVLVPFLSIYIWRERMRDAPAGKHCWAGIIVVLAGLLLFLAGYIGAEFFTKRLSLIIILFGAVLTLEGRARARHFAFPVGFLFFAVPLPYVLYNAVAFPLKMLASRLSVILIGLYGTPVFLEGNVISLPYTTLQVVDACSGIRSLMTLFTLTFLLAFFHHKSFWKRLIVCLLVFPVSVVANGIRVAVIGVLIRYSSIWVAGFWHDFAGWVVFVATFAGLVFCSYLLTRINREGRGR